MKTVFLVDFFHQDGTYHMTSGIAFTSHAAAKRYVEDCPRKAQIKQVDLISLNDY